MKYTYVDTCRLYRKMRKSVPLEKMVQTIDTGVFALLVAAYREDGVDDETIKEHIAKLNAAEEVPFVFPEVEYALYDPVAIEELHFLKALLGDGTVREALDALIGIRNFAQDTSNPQPTVLDLTPENWESILKANFTKFTAIAIRNFLTELYVNVVGANLVVNKEEMRLLVLATGSPINNDYIEFGPFNLHMLVNTIKPRPKLNMLEERD